MLFHKRFKCKDCGLGTKKSLPHLHAEGSFLTYFLLYIKTIKSRQPVIPLKFYHSSDSDFAKELFKISFKI